MNTKSLNDKINVLTDLIDQTADLYNSESFNAQQRGYMETLIGAGIWYLPSDKKLLYSGKISERAYNSLINPLEKTKLVEEHGRVPRKVAGNWLYNKYLNTIRKNPEKLKAIYLDEIGQYNLVLKDENLSIAKFQRSHVFIDEATAYQNAGIKLIEVPLEMLEPLLKNNRTIKQ